jgi:hypothetical protein
MASPEYKLDMLESFSGGLNLRSDQFNLSNNESPDMLNVEVDPRGGIRMRNGVDRRNTTSLSSDVKGVWSLHTQSGTSHLMVNYGTAVAYSASGNFTDLTGISARTAGSRVYGMTMNNVAYGVSYDQPSFKWDGTTASDLSSTFGTSGKMPQARYIGFWNNHCWVANTFESATGHGSRLRWSATNNPESWDTNHYVDIDIGEAGDYITGLAPDGDRLIVFKSNSTHAVYGFDSDSFQVVTLSGSVGSIPSSSPVPSPYGVFFWYGREGVYLQTHDRPVWLFQRLAPAIDDGRITFANPPQLAWDGSKLWVSVDWTADGTTTTRRTFMYDPSLGEEGAWVVSNIDAGPLWTDRPPNEAATVYSGGVANTGSVIALDQDITFDRYVADTQIHIDSNFTTTWVSGKNPIVNKRWGKARMVTAANSTLVLNVEVYKDYDRSNAEKTFTVSIEGRAGDAVWGVATWDGVAKWASGSAASISDVKRLPTLGTAKAVSVKVIGPSSTNNTWEVNALAFTYIPRRLR